ncbi:MAG: pyrroline-5-carboxylate reductase [Beijerinckiaceae bacterium]
MSKAPRLLLIGAGKMGGAMLEGWLAGGASPADITVIDPVKSPRMQALAAQGLKLSPPVSQIGMVDVIILAIKPQMLDAASSLLRTLTHADTLLISVLAGKTIADIKLRSPGVKAIVRAMPNTPASVGRGITGCVASAEVSEDQKALADTLLRAIGKVEWVPHEDLIDVVTALSGSGPAYVFHLVECMAVAGIRFGLEPDLAMRLARATVEGAGELLFQDAATPADVLRENVTSPGGTTAAALKVLMAEDGLEGLMERAIGAARQRAEDLSG